MRKRVHLSGVHFLLAVTFCSAIGPATARAALPLEECRLTSAIGSGSVAARCGWYRVRQNRADPQSKELQVHVAVVPALRLQPAGDPLFVLSGGPGQAASDFYSSVSAAFSRIRRDRDIVLVDQRGTGRSNRLQCALPDDSDLTALQLEQLPTLVRACLATLPGDPRYYTTSIAVRDLDDIRAALGYEAIDLYGVSYGTRVAQHYMRRYPRRVRTAILDGVVPAELALGPNVALDAQSALDGTFERCAADEHCATQFPQLADQFASLQAQVRRAPFAVSIPDPITGKPTDARLDQARLSAAIRLLSYSDATIATLPLLIHAAQSLHEPQALAAQYLMIDRNLDEQIATGMHFAVVCSEDAPRWREQDVSDEVLAKTYIGTVFMASMRTICADWPRGPVDPHFSESLQSDVPTLILSGGNDPVTPARYGEQVRKGLRNARHLVLAGQGHGQITNACIARVAAEFVAVGSVATLDDSCVKKIAPLPFMLSRTAAAP